jgi:ATP synthase protein I
VTPQRPATLRQLPGLYFRRAALPAVAVTVGSSGVAWAVDGAAAAWGAALGGLVVLLFFGIDLLAMRVTAGWDPTLTFLLVMVEYLIKIVALALLFLVLRGADPPAVEPRWVGIGLAVAGVAFLTGLVVAYLRVPTFVVDPEAE